MDKLRKLILLLFLLFSLNSSAQDTISIVTYNLLFFPNSGCSPSVINRYDTLRKIMQYLKPDILLVNELQNQTSADLILTNSLNTSGVTYYQKANFVLNQSSGYTEINNMMYYNSNKISLKSQSIIKTTVRDVNKYYVYHKSPGLSTYQDTLFLSIYLAHLKAGSAQTDRDDRTDMCDSIRKYVDNLPTNDFNILTGDCNLQASSEAAFQRLTTGGTKPFVDPLNLLGTWNNDYSMRYAHTQSTRNTEDYDCGVTGGLDDRFDLILFSDSITSGGRRVQFLQNSYAVVGNDGNHMNLSVKANTNKSVAKGMASALFYMSDHLPVLSKIVMYYPPLVPPAFSITNTLDYSNSSVRNLSIFPNPAKDRITFKFPIYVPGTKIVEIISSYGIVVAKYKLEESDVEEHYFSTSLLAPGFYMIRVKVADEEYNARFIKE